MFREFIKHSFSYSFANIFAKGISFFLIPIFTRILNPHDYGILDMITAFSAIILVIIPLEINQGISRYLPDMYEKKKKTLLVSSSFIFIAFATAAFVLFSLIFARWLSSILLGNSMYYEIFIFGIASIAIKIFFDYFQNVLRYQLKAKLYVISSCIFSLLSSLFSLVFLVFFKLGVISIFLGQIIGYTFSTLFSIHFSDIKITNKVDFNVLKKLFSFSIPLLFSSISIIVANYIDRFMIKEMIGIDYVGFYGIGFRFAAIVSIIIIGLQNSLTPLIYNNYKKKETPSEISRIFNLFIILSLTMLVFFSGFSYELIKYFTSTKYLDSIPVIPFLIFSLIASNLYIFTPGLFIEKKVKIISVVNVFIVLENILLNFLLIRFLGITGAALATAISSTTNFVMFFVLGQKLYPIKFHWRKIFLSLIIALSMINIMILFPIESHVFIGIKLFLFVTCVLTMIYTVDFKIMKQLIRYVFRTEK